MIKLKRFLPASWSVLHVGLKNNWLTLKEVITIVNDKPTELSCNQETLIEINVNDDDKQVVLDILEKQIKNNENEGICVWQLAYLLDIEQSKNSVHRKLEEIELQWSKFNYPDSWRDFIYYMPNQKVNSEEGLYYIFIKYLNDEKKRLGLADSKLI